jgi:hypothetical protein
MITPDAPESIAPQIWETMGPKLEQVFTTGNATWSEDFLYVLNRNLPREEGISLFPTVHFGMMPGQSKGFFAHATKQRAGSSVTGDCGYFLTWAEQSRPSC